MMIDEAIILAAGEGRRMRPLTTNRPKVMLPVGGVPVLERVIRSLKDAGIRSMHLVVHYQREAIEQHFGDGSQFDVTLRYHEQGEAKGTGHAVAAVRECRPDKPFILASGDNLVAKADIQALAASADQSLVVGAVRVPDPTRYGALETDGDRLVRIHEKSQAPPSDLVNAGLYRMPPEIFQQIEDLQPSPRGEIELTDAIQRLAENDRVRIHELATWRDVGRPWDLLNATEAILDQESNESMLWTIDGKIEENVHLEGSVRVAKGAHIRSGSYIQGPVVIGPDAIIGPMAFIRGRTTIGARCKVGAHTEIKNSILFDDAKVPHLSYVGDSIIGQGSNLGAGTNIANLRHDGNDIQVTMAPGERVDSGRRKLGVIFGDHVKTGINTSFNIGTVAGSGAAFAPGKSYSGYYEGNKVHWGKS